MANVKQFEPSLVEAIRGLQAQGITPAAMHDNKHVDVPVSTIMAVIKEARMHGWAAIAAPSDALGTDDEEFDDEEDGETVSSEPDTHDFGTPEIEGAGTGMPEVVAEQAQTVAEMIAAGKTPTNVRERRDAPPRGKKAPNTKDNIKMNAERRRRRGGNPANLRRRLLMDESKKNPDFVYRWVLDRPGRITEKTVYDDWDIVTDAHVMLGAGGNVTAVAGTNHYNADKMILVRKRKEYHVEDAKLKLREADILEDQIRQGPGASKDGQSLVDRMGPQAVIERLKNSGDSSNTYVPVGEKISIGQPSETP